MLRILLIALGVVVILAGTVFLFGGDLIRMALAPQDLSEEVVQGLSLADLPEDDVEIVAQNLSIPWGVDFLPDGDILLTERAGTLKRIGTNGTSFEIQGVRHVGEGGLMGVAVHPQFEQNQWIYLYFTTQVDGGLRNRIERHTLADNTLTERTVLLEDIPGGVFHDGGRLAFGPDGYLYATTGDATMPESAQELDNLSGKILRMTDEGTIPPDNPFGTLVYSYGHRNPQGITWDDAGNLWSTEHGPSGLESGQDEVNLIESGQNYGWPQSKGNVVEANTVAPFLHSGEDYTWAPASAAYWDDSIFFGGLRGAALYEVRGISNGSPELIAHLFTDLGRIRTVQLGPDGWLYLTTSNTDGRGTRNEGDDLLLRINPSVFRN